MTGTQSDLVFGTDHALAYFSTDLCFLDLKCLSFCRVNHSAHRSYHYMLTGSNVRCSAYNWYNITITQVYRSQAQLICIRMLLAG
ncbi:hypothetical protein D3C87_1757330 [compost metagenome]